MEKKNFLKFSDVRLQKYSIRNWKSTMSEVSGIDNVRKILKLSEKFWHFQKKFWQCQKLLTMSEVKCQNLTFSIARFLEAYGSFHKSCALFVTMNLFADLTKERIECVLQKSKRTGSQNCVDWYGGCRYSLFLKNTLYSFHKEIHSHK